MTNFDTLLAAWGCPPVSITSVRNERIRRSLKSIVGSCSFVLTRMRTRSLTRLAFSFSLLAFALTLAFLGLAFAFDFALFAIPFSGAFALLGLRFSFRACLARAAGLWRDCVSLNTQI